MFGEMKPFLLQIPTNFCLLAFWPTWAEFNLGSLRVAAQPKSNVISWF